MSHNEHRMRLKTRLVLPSLPLLPLPLSASSLPIPPPQPTALPQLVYCKYVHVQGAATWFIEIDTRLTLRNGVAIEAP